MKLESSGVILFRANLAIFPTTLLRSITMSTNDDALRQAQQAQIDLTAALRWADRLGLSEGVCNHFSLVVPGKTDRFLLNPQGLHWSELQVSDLLVVDQAGNVVAGKWTAEPTAFFIHSRIHLGNPAAKCVLHTHMPYATALCSIDGGRLEWIHQNSMRFYERVAYEEEYNGLALDEAAGERIAEKLATGKVLFLANHGVIVIGPDVATAFDDLYYLERACMTQVLAHSTGAARKRIPDHVCHRTLEQMETERQQSSLHLESIKRILSREAPEFLE